MEERTKPVVHVITDKPPSKPPPSLEQNISYHIDEAQWIADIQTAADTSLNNRDIQHAACLCPHDYIPSVKKLSQNNAINKHHLSIKRQQLQHHHRRDPIKCTLIPSPTYLHIPTPKKPTRHGGYQSANAIHYTNWKYETSTDWTSRADGRWYTSHAKPSPPNVTPHLPNDTHHPSYSVLP